MDIRFSIAGRAGRVDADHPIWTEVLSMPVRSVPADQGKAAAITHGEYFQAIQTYFQNEGGLHLRSALQGLDPEASSLPVPERIDVVLEKHGEFYHPARIRTTSPGRSRPFVLNVAATPTGFKWMDNEIEALRQVLPRLPEGSVPRVYGRGGAESANGVRFRMFLADWFEGFHEFHLAVDPRDGAQKIVVWDNRPTPFFLPANLTKDVYYQTAFLLARAYDPRTTRQIYPWHHASGDFVLRHLEEGLELKLISVRQYASTLAVEGGQAPDEESRQMAAMVFFANLTLRNRIDRFDGTGKMAWAGDAAVAPTVAGFRQALTDSQIDALRGLLANYDTDDWIALLTAVGAQYLLMPVEKALLARHTASHAVCLLEAIQREFHV
ncbi:MAG: hypothetical protein JJV98_11105 [Desulfosarcina sp.]|nr:hypothetical protein [Desulfobacterales bacterium]